MTSDVKHEMARKYLRSQLDREDFDGVFYPVDLLDAFEAGYEAYRFLHRAFSDHSPRVWESHGPEGEETI